MSPPDPLTISVVTPSYQQPDWLRLCAASVADQHGPGLEVEHIVQDSLSGPEIAAALRPFPRVQLFSEKDEGMYDAINRGWDRSRGEIVAWLNCDEQYLPGTLARVAEFFRTHPEIDVLFADAVVVDVEGSYLCSRQVLLPHLYHTWTCHLNTFSCSMWLRRSLLRERGFRLDSSWKGVGDGVLIRDFLLAGVRMATLDAYTSSFVDSGENKALEPATLQEIRNLCAQAPLWVQWLRPAWRIAHRLRRMRHGHYRPKPFAFEIYLPSSPARRVHMEVPRPTFYWGARMNVT